MSKLVSKYKPGLYPEKIKYFTDRDNLIYELTKKLKRLSYLLKKFYRHDLVDEYVETEKELEVQLAYQLQEGR